MPRRDKSGHIIIKLSEEQYYWILRFFNREWDAEVKYRKEEGAGDTSYLEDLLDKYVALLGTPAYGLEAMSMDEDYKSKKKDIEEIKNEK